MPQKPKKRRPHRDSAGEAALAYAIREPSIGHERTMSASAFKARCLALLDSVAANGEEIIVTKRGRPIARLVAFQQSEPRSVRGSVTFLTDNEEDLFSTGELPEFELPKARSRPSR